MRDRTFAIPEKLPKAFRPRRVPTVCVGFVLLASWACRDTPTDVYVASSSELINGIAVDVREPTLLDAPSRVLFRSVYMNTSPDSVEITAGEQCWDFDVIRATRDTTTVWNYVDWLKARFGNAACEAYLNVYRLPPGDSAQAMFTVKVADVLGDSLAPGAYAFRLKGSLGFNQPRGPFRSFVLTSPAATFIP